MSMSVPGNSCRSNRCCTPPTQGCVVRIPGGCAYYSGSNISGPGINTGDTFNVVVNKLVSYISVGPATGDEIEFAPGDPGMPVVGATTYVSSDIVNRKVLVVRNGLIQRGTDPGDGSTYITKVLASNTITFSHALIADDYIQIIII